MKKLRIGTRKSALSRKQTDLVIKALQMAYPQMEIEVVPFQTRGDLILDRPLWELSNQGKGVFASEFEEMICKDEIDIAVHSGKDLPIFLAEGLEIVAVLERGDPRDVLIMPKGKKAEDCKVIGTGSLRRKQYMANLFPQAECRLIRGNIQTRLKKLQNGCFDAILLAKAGLDRMGITEEDGYTFRILSPQECLPAACQGTIVVEGKAEMTKWLDKISEETSKMAFEAEREVLRQLNADCSEPAAAFAQIKEDKIRLRVAYRKQYAEGEARVAERMKLVADVVRRLK